MRLPTLTSIAASIACACVLGCSDSSGPRALHPMAGMYDVTTIMDSVGFRSSCPPPAYGYCWPNAPTNGMVAVSGLLTVGDSLTFPGDGSARQLAVTGLITLQGCAGGSSGCASRGSAETGEYTAAITEDQLANPPMSFVLRRPTSAFGVSLSATFAGDSLYGIVGFTDYGLSRYSGHFVARRMRMPQ